MIRPATPEDVPTIARLIRALAEYERLSDRVVFDEEKLREHLFGERRFAEVLLAEDEGAIAAIPGVASAVSGLGNGDTLDTNPFRG